MIISFRNKKLEKQLATPKDIQMNFGTRAKNIQARLSDLRSASSLADIPKVPPHRCHALTGDRQGQYSIDVSANFRLLFEIANEEVYQLPDGSIDLARVTEIRILEIVDTH